MYQDRVVVPQAIRSVVLENLHSAHQGVASMELRARSLVFWSGMSRDIQDLRDRCSTCNKNAPSHAPLPPEKSDPPTTPFEQVFADFFEFAGRHYLIVGDRLSGWAEVYSTPPGGQYSGVNGLLRCLRSFFGTFGVPEELSSDGGPEFTAKKTRDFLQTWDIRHRVSSAYFPQSNGRAEVAVKTAKRLMRSNVGVNGSLHNDHFLRAMLQHRNTPDPDSRLSPAEIVFGRRLKDAFCFTAQLKDPRNSSAHPSWTDAWVKKEMALRKRFVYQRDRASFRTKNLRPLNVGDQCFLQNQHGPYPKRWDRSGTVVEVLPHHQYTVKVHGSGRLTRRNRRFLRWFVPASTSITGLPPAIEYTEPDAVANPTTTTTPEEEVRDRDGEAEPATETTREPLMIRRLRDHNNSGLKETPLPVDNGRLRSTMTRRETP